MSHELRTPLNAIIGFSEMMTNQVFGPLGSNNYVEYAGDIQFSGKHLLGIVESILDLAKIEAGQFNLREDKMSLNETVRAARKLLDESAEKKGIKIETDLPKKTIGILGDPRVIRQILLNLLSNAIKFTDEGGHVALRIFKSDNGDIMIEVEDDGIGMSEEDLVKALEPFGQVQSSLSREYEGTGLGLSLTKKFAELHDGHLVIDSTPGKGTCARIILPASRVIASKAKDEDKAPTTETGPDAATA
jgi:signal transduction histidine kinase